MAWRQLAGRSEKQEINEDVAVWQTMLVGKTNSFGKPMQTKPYSKAERTDQAETKKKLKTKVCQR